MADRVLVTGVSGFLGGHVALQLLERGYVVRGSVRDSTKGESARKMLAAAGADLSRFETCRLDLLRDDGWAEAADGCTYLQHVASPFVLIMPKDKSALVRPAVEGVRRALTAAMDAGVTRMVVTSSLAAIDGGHRDYDRMLGASDWTDITGPMVNAYTESKTLAEREAWKLVDDHDRRQDLVTVNPGAILGPLLDDDPGTSGVVIQRLISGQIPVMPNIRLPYVDVRDVAAAHVAAMESPTASGQRILISNPTWSIFDLAAALARDLPERRAQLPKYEMPDWAARLLGWFDRSIGDSRAYLGIDRRYDGSSGEKLLGRPLGAPARAAVDMARSMIARGIV